MKSPETYKAIDDLMKQRPKWAHSIILSGLRGSDAHGTKLEEDSKYNVDDVDTFAVSVQKPEFYLGLSGYLNNTAQKWETAGNHYDHLIYDLRKFVHLLLKGNPNVHSWLWTDVQHIGIRLLPGHWLIDNRQIFISQRCLKATIGYANAQMKKMSRQKFQGYQGKKRKKIVKELGYDCKAAAHCVRLMFLGKELVLNHTMHTLRTPRETTIIKEIKSGQWTFDETHNFVSELFNEMVDLEAASDLPLEPEYERAEKLMLDIINFCK